MIDEGVSRGMLETAEPRASRWRRADRAARAPPPTAPPCRGSATRASAGTGAAGRAPPPTTISRYGQYAEAAELYAPRCRRAARTQSGQQPARRRARAGRPPARGRGGASRRDRAARRSCRLLAGLAGAAPGLTSDLFVSCDRRFSMTISKAALADRAPAWRPGARSGRRAEPAQTRCAAAAAAAATQRAGGDGGAGPAERQYNLNRARADRASCRCSPPCGAATGRRRRRLCRRRGRRRAATTPNIWSARSGSRSASAPATGSSSRRR